MEAMNNPTLGTRQHPQIGYDKLPEAGYPGDMTIGEAVKRQRLRLGWSQEVLAEKAQTGQSTVDRIEKDDFKRMPSALPRIARALGVSLDQLDGSLADLPQSAYDAPQPPLVGDRDLPVFASAEGGDGAVVISPEPVDYVRRPAPLGQVRDAYALIVIGESMAPELRAGDTALIHPHLPPVRDEACVFYADDGHGEVKVTVKVFLRQTASAWHVKQWNPEREFTLPRKEWQKCHRVVGRYSRR